MNKEAKANLMLLIAECGLNVSAVAAASGINRATLSNKVNGYRPWFADEVAALVDGLNHDGTKEQWIDLEDIEAIIGEKNIMLRGTLADHRMEWT